MSFRFDKWDAGNTERHGDLCGTCMPGDKTYTPVLCSATYPSGERCEQPVTTTYERLPDVWEGRLTLCQHHQQIEEAMLGRAA